ncbi:AAA family ATPase [Bacillus sp. AGMB 02131]|uniref:AAA family ATPase n=1 Tax=Peribacillus faecalis TaxID=2772559 RepID=A0A927CW80_9BACI|nr:UvrD-helicase domain-containing protein [Peribacillus faecalis]MBD3108206.1 AAA family ATPase [Peribacillus faecalis]
MQQFQDEQQALDAVFKKLRKAFDQVNTTIEGYNDEYMNLKKYMVDYKAEMDKIEIFSNQQILQSIDRTGVAALKQRMQLQKLMDSAYFGRIDFVYDGESIDEAETFYIGKFSFTDEEGNICIYDWRAPVSSMYYDYELGPAAYEALNGAINGELIRKRQMNVEKNEIRYVLESSMNINDSILQGELSRTADERMKTIIATIQKEQNAIVRNEDAHTLVIQGVAGSGKTSIALHRVAYLLYKFKDQLSSDRVMIISPNKVFADYISTVLPELGEEPIREASLDLLAERVLPAKYAFSSLFEQTKRCIEQPESPFAKRVGYKSSLSFFAALQSYLEKTNTTLLQEKAITISEYEIPGSYIVNRFNASSNEPVMKRLEQTAEDMLSLIKAKRQGEIKLPSKNEVIKRLKKRLRFNDAFTLYKSFYEELGRQDDFVFKNKTLEFADVYPLLYCINYWEGIEIFDTVNHLVIDEMQDYSPIQYAVLQRLFRCKKTILGDFGQSLNPFTINDEHGFQEIFPSLQFVQLKKSYRSSYEIIEFAKRFLPENAIEAVERHGEEPAMLTYQTDEEQIDSIKQALQQFQKSGYKTYGIVCKTEAQATYIESVLQGFPINRINETSTSFTEGITLCSVQLAKGLEFDSVIVPFIDGGYQTDYDKGLLYIACTRALHRLTLLVSEQNKSPLL